MTSSSMPMSQKEQLEKKLSLLVRKREATRDMLERLRQQGAACSEELVGIDAQLSLLHEQLEAVLATESANGNGAAKAT